MAAFIPVDVCPLKKNPQIRAGMQMEHDFSVRSNKKFSEINGIAEKVVLFFFSRGSFPNGNLCSFYRFLAFSLVPSLSRSFSQPGLPRFLAKLQLKWRVSFLQVLHRRVFRVYMSALSAAYLQQI